MPWFCLLIISSSLMYLLLVWKNYIKGQQLPLGLYQFFIANQWVLEVLLSGFWVLRECWKDSFTQISFSSINHHLEVQDFYFFSTFQHKSLPYHFDQTYTNVCNTKLHAMESITEIDCANYKLSHSPVSCIVLVTYPSVFRSITKNTKTPICNTTGEKKKKIWKETASLKVTYCTHQKNRGQWFAILLYYLTESKRLLEKKY